LFDDIKGRTIEPVNQGRIAGRYWRRGSLNLVLYSDDARGRAALKIKEGGVLAGIEVAEKIFSMSEPGATFRKFKSDGEDMYPGDIAFDSGSLLSTRS
jgi:hypothetical protein